MVGESEAQSEGESVLVGVYRRGNGWRGRVLGSRGSRGVTWLHTSARCPPSQPRHDADQDYHSDEDELLILICDGPKSDR